MNIIEKIEIKHFRSFDGGKDQVKVKINNLKDLNVFSGANDSGKSNILRALNLFFNNEISPGVSFDKDRDFSKIVSSRFNEEIIRRRKEESEKVDAATEKDGTGKARDLRRADIVVSIKVFFYNSERQRKLPEKFWISKIYSQKNNFSGEYIYPSALKEKKAQVKLFLNSFRYEYVPAIKDKAYFSHLFEKLQNYLFEKEDRTNGNKFSNSSEDFNEILKSETSEIFAEFQKSSGVDASFHIPSTLVDFFRTLSVKTENDISLFDRGDGVQARFIPEILDEISKSAQKNIIWGFEEPENSYETKNIRRIKDDFINKYSKDKQIFITSHTNEFLAIKRNYTEQEVSIKEDKTLNTQAKKDTAFRALSKKNRSSDVSIYRVWRGSETKYCSYITRFDENNRAWEKTCDDLGIVQEARIIESLQEKLGQQAEELASSTLSSEKKDKVFIELNAKMESVLSELEGAKFKIEEYEKPILVIEDKYPAIYKIAYLKLNGFEFSLDNLDLVFEQAPFVIRRAEGAGSVAGMLRMNNTDGYDEKSIIGLFDFDSEGAEHFYKLKGGCNWDDLIQGDQESGLYKQRNQHPCFYGLLLPIPQRHTKLVSSITEGKFVSFVEIENLLPSKLLIDKNLVDEDEILDTVYLKVRSDVKSKLIKQVLIDLTRDYFEDFQPLFDKIEELFGIEEYWE